MDIQIISRDGKQITIEIADGHVTVKKRFPPRGLDDYMAEADGAFGCGNSPVAALLKLAEALEEKATAP